MSHKNPPTQIMLLSIETRMINKFWEHSPIPLFKHTSLWRPFLDLHLIHISNQIRPANLDLEAREEVNGFALPGAWAKACWGRRWRRDEILSYEHTSHLLNF